MPKEKKKKPTKPRHQFRRVLRRLRATIGPPRLGVYAVPAVLLVAFSYFYGSQTSHSSTTVFLEIFRDALPLMLLALGAGLVLSAGYVDLSSAGMGTLAGFCFISICFRFVAISPGWGLDILILLAAIGVAVMCACVSAVMASGIVYQDAPPLIVTWAVGAILLLAPLPFIPLLPKAMNPSSDSIAGRFLSEQMKIGTHEQWYAPATSGWMGEFGWLAIGAVLLIFAILAILGFTNMDRRACAIGANDLAAFYAGVNKRKTAITVYAIAGFLSGLSGISNVVLHQSFSGGGMRGWELFGIAIAVLGGTSMSGGFLYMFAIVVAALTFSAIQFYTSTLFRTDVTQMHDVCALTDWFSVMKCALENQEGAVVYSLFYVVMLVVMIGFGRALLPNIGVVLKNWERDLPR